MARYGQTIHTHRISPPRLRQVPNTIFFYILRSQFSTAAGSSGSLSPFINFFDLFLSPSRLKWLRWSKIGRFYSIIILTTYPRRFIYHIVRREDLQWKQIRRISLSYVELCNRSKKGAMREKRKQAITCLSAHIMLWLHSDFTLSTLSASWQDEQHNSRPFNLKHPCSA